MIRLGVTALLMSASMLVLQAATITSGEIDVPYSQFDGAEEFSFTALTSTEGGYSISGYSDGFANLSWPNAPAIPLGATTSVDWSVGMEASTGGSVTYVDGISYPSVYFSSPLMHFNIQPFTVIGAGTYSLPFQLVASGTLSAYVAGGSLYDPALIDENVQGSGIVTFQLVQSEMGFATQDFYLGGNDVSFVFSAPDSPTAPEPSTWVTVTLGAVLLALGMRRLKNF